MADSPSGAEADDQEQNAPLADIKVTAQGDRRTVEAIYLELRELAKRNGLKIDYRLSVNKPHRES